MHIREARDSDSAGLIRLIATIFTEYPGCVLEVDQEEPELRAPATLFERLWILEDDGGEVAGSVGLSVGGSGRVVVLIKLYLRKDLRRRGWGARLVGMVEDHARGIGAKKIELWSDTRFTAAHALYEALGYRCTGRTRELHDLSFTIESHFEKILD